MKNRLRKVLIYILMWIVVIVSINIPEINIIRAKAAEGNVFYYNNHKYQVFIERKSWSEAENACIAMGGHLATITSAEEQDIIEKHKGNERLWLGGFRDENNNWWWVTNERWYYTNWGSGEPNGGTGSRGENRLSIWPSKWNDLVDGSGEQNGYICEWDDFSELITPSESNELSEKSNYTFSWGSSRYAVIKKRMNWSDAKDYCERIGGSLATLNSIEEYDFVHQSLKDDSRLWLGGIKESSRWVWISGEELRDIEIINDSFDKNRLLISNNGCIAQNENSSVIEGFICEYKSIFNVLDDESGLYSDDQLILGWEQLLDKGYISVNGNTLSRINKEYALSDNTCLVIDSGIDTIGERAFENCKNIETIYIPNTVVNIKEHAFENCSGMKKITIPDSILRIEPYTFLNCTNLEEVILPHDLEEVGYNAFSGCKKLKEINLPETIIRIEDGAFEECDSLVKIRIPHMVKHIDRVVSGCDNLEIVELQEGLKDIGNLSFRDCPALRNIDIPESVELIGYSAFENCKSLEQLVIPKNVAIIDRDAFNGCSSLKEILFEGNPPKIDERNFKDIVIIGKYPKDNSTWSEVIKKDYNNHVIWKAKDEYKKSGLYFDDEILVDWETAQNEGYIRKLNGRLYKGSNWPIYSEIVMVVGDDIEEIEDFSNTTNLKEVYLSDSVLAINNYAFSNCANLETFVFGNSVRKIGDNSFGFCSSLKEIDIPDSVMSIGRSAFSFCSNLKKIRIPSYIERLDIASFTGCAIDSLEIPDRVKNIGMMTFQGCTNLRSVTIPKSVTNIDGFAFSSCPQLKEIIICGENVEFGNNNPLEIKGKGVIYVPAGKEEEYTLKLKNTGVLVDDEHWIITSHRHAFSEYVVDDKYLISEATCDKKSTYYTSCKCGMSSAYEFFESGDYLEHIWDEGEIINNQGGYEDQTIKYRCTRPACTGQMIKVIKSHKCGENAFWTYIDGTLTIEGGGSITRDSWLDEVSENDIEKIIISEGITSLQVRFWGYRNLEKVCYPYSLNDICNDSLGWCTKLTSAGPQGSGASIEYAWTKRIPNNAFYGAYMLENVSFPDGIESIGERAFANCTALKTIEIPLTIDEIKKQTFDMTLGASYSSEMTKIILPENITIIGEKAFNGCDKVSEIVVMNPTCRIYDGNSVFPRNIILKGYANSSTKEYAEKYGYTFSEIESIETVPYLYDDSTNTLTVFSDGFCECDISYQNKIQKLIIKGDVKGINDDGFSNCPLLEIVDASNSELEEIGESAFANCDRLKQVILPKTVKGIKEKAFINCNSLESINLPDSVETIGVSAFEKTGLNRIIIPLGLKRIENRTFYYCSNLEDIVITSNVEYIGEDAFAINNTKKIIVPDNVKVIDNGAFRICQELQEVVLPKELDYLGIHVFDFDIKLQKINIPDNLEVIPEGTFSYCSSLKEIEIPNGVIKIEKYAFEKIGVNKIVLPDSVEMVEEKAFVSIDGDCTIVIRSNNTRFNQNAIYSSTYGTIQVPNDTVDYYVDALKKANIKVGDDGWKVIEENHIHIFDKMTATKDYLASPANCVSAATYYKYCKCGEVSQVDVFSSGMKLGHIWGNAEITKDSTEEEEGIETKHCIRDDCEVSIEYSIPIKEHVHVFNIEKAEYRYLICKASCENKAIYSYSCKCGEKGGDYFEYGDPLGHDLESWVEKEPTETSVGKRCYSCIRKECDYYKVEEIPIQVHTHIYNEEVAKDEYLMSPATCLNRAIYFKSCKCGGISLQDAFVLGEPLGHEWDDGMVIQEATEVTEGVIVFSCKRDGCNKTRKDIIPTKNHIHVFNQMVVADEYLASKASCTKKASYYKTCICGETDLKSTFETGEKLQHVWDEGTITQEPTINNNGEKTYKCKNSGCTKTKTEIIDRLKQPSDENKIVQFLNRIYTDCLGRLPDSSGVQYWRDELAQGNTDGASVGAAFVFSEEYLRKSVSKKEYVKMLYKVFMGREADEGGLKYWLDCLDNGMTREEVFKGFVYSPEYTQICADYGIVRGEYEIRGIPDPTFVNGVVTPEITSFVERIYVKALNRESDPDGIKYWAQEIANESKSPVDVAELFIFSEEFESKKLDDTEYVKVLYRTFMGREFDEAGLNYWLGQIAAGQTRKDVLEAFAGCQEFQDIVKSFGL